MRKKRWIIALLAAGLFYPARGVFADWSVAQRLTWDSEWSEDPAIAIDSGDNIHIVWDDDRPGNAEIYYKNSPDGGTTWSDARRITWTSNFSLNPAIAVDSSDHLHVVWEEFTVTNNEFYYKSSPDGGATWSAVRRITWTSGSSSNPALAVDSDDKIHVVWSEWAGDNNEIYYKSSADGGSTWSDARRITWTEGSSTHPAIDADGSIGVTWQDNTPGNFEIYYRGSTDGGAAWSPVQRITWTAGYSEAAAIALGSGGAIHVVWDDNDPGNGELHYKKSTDGGANWSAAKRITWTSGDSTLPAMTLDSSGTIHVVWKDDTPGVSEIYHKLSADGGANWSAAQRITWTSGSSSNPAVSADSGNRVHVVWDDHTPGNYEIYYKNGN
jgi:hypothetical protein